MAQGRDPMPKRVRFTTWTLRYNRMAWITVDALERHWERARVEAQIAGADRIEATTTNVVALTLSIPAGLCPLTTARRPIVVLDGHAMTAPAVAHDWSWSAPFHQLASP